MVSTSTSSTRINQGLPALGVRVAVLAALAVGAMIIDQRTSQLDFARRAIGTVVYPIQILVSLPSELADWAADSRVSREELRREIASLRAERLRIRAELQQLNDMKAENDRLRAMLKASDRVADDYIMAELIAVDADRYRHSIVLNKGTSRGVFEGQAMVDANGVIGQVIEAGKLSSIALLISDPDHMLPVENLRNGLRTFVVGTGELGRLSVQNLPNTADIEIGDQLVTSGLGGAFPAGYPVGVVSDITLRPGQPFAAIAARPVARLDQITEVVLISDTQEITDTETAIETPAPNDASATGDTTESTP